MFYYNLLTSLRMQYRLEQFKASILNLVMYLKIEIYYGNIFSLVLCLLGIFQNKYSFHKNALLTSAF